ncbi:MAG TPA: hypothetical protein VMA35_09930 [Candidatus Sulfopaludibacter sp.]|nr:hypothetical protein [Candidatus Sulfopaludibacter sp.]
MKLSKPPFSFAGRRRDACAAQRASVLVIVMLIAFGLISIALYFAHSMTFELRASDNRASGLVTEQAIEGAARYVSYLLATYGTNGMMPTNNTEFVCAAVPIGQAHFWLIGRDPSGTPSSDPYFGLIDEGSKLDLNTVNTNILSYLPNMTLDFADAIVDWRSTNGGGTYALNYSSLGYQDKNAPFETEDELRLVYGATMDLLVGNDINQNGVLDANEQNGDGNGQWDPGLFEYVTVYTREPNFHADGSSLTNVNTASQTRLETLFQSAGIGNASGLAETLSVEDRTTPCRGMLDFCVRCKNASMSSSDFGKIYNNITTSTNAYIYGRLNVNTASVPVLEALFMGLNVDQQTADGAAQTLLTYREQNPSNLGSLAWIVDALGNTSPVIQALERGDYVTTRSFQFTADIAAIGPYGRGYRRVKFIFDTSDGTPKIIYRQDLTRLGWALGEKIREAWVTQRNDG